MKILAVDTTAASASAALCEDGFLLGETYVNIKQVHSQTLMPAVAGLLSRCGCRVSDIGLFAVSNGPGSFTGVRIGVSAVKGMALPHDVPCAAVSSLEALAYNLPFSGRTVCAVMDARRGGFYNAFFDCSSGIPNRLSADRASDIEEIRSDIIKSEDKVILVGDGAEKCNDILEESCGTVKAPQNLRFARASSVAEAGLCIYRQGGTVSAEKLLPAYLRMPQAERKLKHEGNVTEEK